MHFLIAVSLVASYAKKNSRKLTRELFKYPEDFKIFLENNTPRIVCFANYSWTMSISYEFAKKIKEKNPRTIVIFGCDWYPNENEAQKSFLSTYPVIDFYIKGERRIGFCQFV